MRKRNHVLGPQSGTALAHECLEDRRLLAQTTGLFFNEPGASEGYTLFAPNTSNTTFLIDRDANLVNEWTSNHLPGLLAYMLPDGSLLRASAPFGQSGNGSINAAGSGGLFERFDWEGNKTWEFAYNSQSHLAHHDFEIMPNGNILAIAWTYESEIDATQAGRDPNLPGPGYLYPDQIVEIEPDYENGGGEIVWEWNVWDHLVQDFDPTKDNWYGPDGVSEHPELININYVSTFDDGAGDAEDWTHANGIDYNAELDQILLSVREFNEIWIIDHSTTTEEAAGHSGGNSGRGGDLLYRWGNPEAYGRGDDSDRVLFYQHDAKWVEDGAPGAGNITIFNNGFGRPGQDFTTIEEIAPPLLPNGSYALGVGEAYGPIDTVWTYQAPLENFSAIISGTQRLANGNTLITYGVNGTFVEVTPQGDEVWKYVSPYVPGGVLGPEDPIPSLGVPDPVLGTLFANFTFRAIDYPLDYLASTAVEGRFLFYNHSKFDGFDPAANADDDGAIATDKSPYFAGSGIAQPSAATSYVRGINGLMVDIANPAGTLTASDFTFKVNGGASNNDPSTWTAVAAAATVVVRPGAGVNGSDRVQITWPDNAIQDTWLQVIVRGNDTAGGFNTNTGLAASDVFYFGNRIGDTFVGSPPLTFLTNAGDEIGARGNVGVNRPITDVYDFNKDGLVNAGDMIAARSNGGLIFRIDIPAPGAVPLAIEDAGSKGTASAVATALAAKNERPSATTMVAPLLWPVETRLAAEPLARLATLLVTRERSTSMVGGPATIDQALDEELLDELLGSLA